MIYVGGGGVLLAILLLLAFSLSGRSRNDAPRPTSPQPVAEPAAHGPYRTDGEARKALSHAQRLFDEGKELEGGARNSRYAETAQICGQILESPVSERLKEDAARLKYSAGKCMTLR